MVKWSAVCRFQSGKRWERTVAPSVGSPAQLRARFEGFEANLPIFVIDDLVYLPRLTSGSSPRKGAPSASASLTSGRLFGRGTKRSAASIAADGEAEGPSSPSPFRPETPSPSQKAPVSAAAPFPMMSDASQTTQDATPPIRSSSRTGKQRA